MPRSSKESLLKRLKAESEGLLIDLLQLIGFILLLWIGELLVNKTVGEVLMYDKFQSVGSFTVLILDWLLVLQFERVEGC
jgi:hypothetical protein